MLSSEERFYLALGVKRFGGTNNFEKILSHYRFALGRTASELDLEWQKTTRNHTKEDIVHVEVLNDAKDVNPLYDDNNIMEAKLSLSIFPVWQERLVDCICEELQCMASMLSPSSSDDDDDDDHEAVQRKSNQLEWTQTRLDTLMASWIAAGVNPQRKLVWRILEACLPLQTRTLTADWLTNMSDCSALSHGKSSSSTRAKRIWRTVMREIRAAELETELTQTLPLLQVLVTTATGTPSDDDISVFANENIAKWSTKAQVFDGEARRLCKSLLLLL